MFIVKYKIPLAWGLRRKSTNIFSNQVKKFWKFCEKISRFLLETVAMVRNDQNFKRFFVLDTALIEKKTSMTRRKSYF